jgi:hypothetical protein
MIFIFKCPNERKCFHTNTKISHVCLFDNGGVADAAAEHEVLYAEEKGESAKAAFIKDHLETNTNFYKMVDDGM